MDKKCGSERWRGDFWQPRDGCHRGMAGQRAADAATLKFRAREGCCAPAIQACFLFQIIAFNNCGITRCDSPGMTRLLHFRVNFFDCSDMIFDGADFFSEGESAGYICYLF